MRIAFITDLHVAGEDEKPLGVDVRQNFLNALQQAKELHPLALVIGGDICYQSGDQAIYHWVCEQLRELPFPTYLIAGNHDDVALLATEMKLTHHVQQGELYYAFPMEGYPTLFLDTSKGEMSPEQWTWLSEHLRALRDTNLVIFMHHPPLKAGVGHMDTYYPFKQSDQFIDLINEVPCHVTVFCGHYHVEKWIQRSNLTVLITPSLFFQMKHDPIEMVIDHYRPAVREINFTPNGLTSTVHYL